MISRNPRNCLPGFGERPGSGVARVMEGVDPGMAGVPPRERRKPGDGGVFTFLFVISGLVIAAIPVVMWFYFDHNEGTLKPHTVRHAPPASLLRLDPTRISTPCVSPSPAFRIIQPLEQQEMKFVPLGLGGLNGSSGR